MSGDPVEEGGQAVRTGFVQALQTTAMTMNLVQRRGAESRSVAEFQGRQEDRGAERGRKDEIHRLQRDGYRDRATNARELHDLEVKIKKARLDHDADEAARRETSSANTEQRRDGLHRWQVRGYRAEDNRKAEIHTRQLRGYDKRAAQGAHLYNLEVEYKRLLIEARRRSLGFTETLAQQGGQQTYAAATSAAAWAAAHSTAELSEEHQSHADAYAERFAEDTADSPQAFLAAATPEQDRIGTDELTWPSEVSESIAAVSDSMAGLAGELAFGIYGEHTTQDPSDIDIDIDSEDDPGAGTGIAAAIVAVSPSDTVRRGIDAAGPIQLPSSAGPHTEAGIDR